QDMLQQVLEGANYAKYGLFILPPKNSSEKDWLTAGNAIMGAMTMESEDPLAAAADITLLENAVRSVPVSEKEFRKHFGEFRESIVKRAESRGEYTHIGTEVSYFRKDYFLNALVHFLIGSLCALVMWASGAGKTGKWLS